MTIRTMSLKDLRKVLAWAASEGWNPGLDDAEAFFAADPNGFLVKTVGGQLVSAISVVNHTDDFSFLGLYLCRPEFRGAGHGIDVWNAGIAHAGSRSIGLDGVPDQQANYARSGFVTHGKTVRYEGTIAQQQTRARQATSEEIAELVARDARSSGVQRHAFSHKWFTGAPNRQTVVLDDNGADLTAHAVFRRCGTGSKLGPFEASNDADAFALLAANPFPAPLFIDVHDSSPLMSKLLTKLGFAPVFETARMYRGAQPTSTPARFQAIATMELG